MVDFDAVLCMIRVNKTNKKMYIDMTTISNLSYRLEVGNKSFKNCCMCGKQNV